jgi:hypothetical protein
LQCGEGVGFIHHTYIMLEPYWYCNSIFVPGSPRHLSHIEPSVQDHREPIKSWRFYSLRLGARPSFWLLPRRYFKMRVRPCHYGPTLSSLPLFRRSTLLGKEPSLKSVNILTEL